MKKEYILVAAGFIAMAVLSVGNAKAQDQVQSFDRPRALSSPAAQKGLENLKLCLIGNIDKDLRQGMRSKSAIAKQAATSCYRQLSVPLNREHITVGITDDQFEQIVEKITYNMIDEVAAQEIQQPQ